MRERNEGKNVPSVNVKFMRIHVHIDTLLYIHISTEQIRATREIVEYSREYSIEKNIKIYIYLFERKIKRGRICLMVG